MRLAATVVIALALAGCPAATPDAGEPVPGGDGRPASSAPHAAMLEAAVDLDGLAIGPLAPGERATLAMVFASWCGHCRDEMLVLDALHERHPELRIVGVNYRGHEEYDGRGDADAVRAFVAERGPWMRVIPAGDALWARLGRPPKVPTLYLFDGRGALVRTFDRRTDELPTLDDLESALAGL